MVIKVNIQIPVHNIYNNQTSIEFITHLTIEPTQ